ncbi:MAG: 8-amino-7-oxononanoate synthase [Desulfovibrio sp.]|jgi:8-amino-7-oxononanoate synthase|nr:8-amino-7-oxononanoate synthase [Desulfovibrio sp.]
MRNGEIAEMDFAARLSELKKAHLHRSVYTFCSPQGREAEVNGKRVLVFSSNNYLGLAQDPVIKQKATAALERFGVGTGSSRLVAGNMTPHMELEALLASFKGTEAALVFTSGYTANVGVISALCDRDSVIFSDALNHASIIDGCRLSKAKTVVYAHNDPDDLLQKIRETCPGKGLIVTDGVFSMDGDIAHLPELARISREHKLLLMVDDAHATGVLGETGRGTLEHFGLGPDAVDVVMGTLSKAIPSEGGFICGSRNLCEYVRNTARAFIYTTSPSPATVAAAAGGIEHIRDHPETVRRLQDNVRHFASRLRASGLPCAGETPIVPVVVGGEALALRASEELFNLGIFVPAIRYPTVAKGQARLRFALSAAHTHDDLDYAAACALAAIQSVDFFSPSC